MRLTSLLDLRKEVKKNEHKGERSWDGRTFSIRSIYSQHMYLVGLSDIFADHTFVGVVDDALALIQHQTKLYLVNYSVIRYILL